MLFLVKKAQKRDDQAFVELMETYKSSMYKVARSYLHRDEDIADAVSQTILDCYDNIVKLHDPKYFKTWMIRILINNCKDMIRQNQKEHLLEAPPEKGEECMELKNYEFQELMNSLDDKYRVILLLYYGEGFKIREIAQILEMDENTVKTRLSRGRKKLGQVYSLKPAAERR